MGTDAASVNPGDPGATAVITHRVREDRHSDYDRWVEEIGPLCRAWPGHLDWHIIRPIPGLTSTYTVVIRFDTRAHLQAWMESPVRERLIEKVRSLLGFPDDHYLTTLAVTGTVVFLMVYVVMPRYTKLIRRWLFA
ncbi:MAG: antibiotic biosynthesis monooxygenase [Thiogranum sp.]|jgi:hypothetical protein